MMMITGTFFKKAPIVAINKNGIISYSFCLLISFIAKYRIRPIPNPPKPYNIFSKSELYKRYELTTTARIGTTHPKGILKEPFIPRFLNTIIERHVGMY